MPAIAGMTQVGTCPGRSAAPYCFKDARERADGDALQTRDPGSLNKLGPGSAVHHFTSFRAAPRPGQKTLHCRPRQRVRAKRGPMTGSGGDPALS
jgi:hypothetical protein